MIKTKLEEFIFLPAINSLGTRLESLIVRNMAINGYSHRSFVYKGVFYVRDPAPPPTRRNRLAPQLKDEFEKWLVDQDALINDEMPKVLGYVSTVLNASRHFDDYLRIFPECLHPPLREFVGKCPCRTSILSDEDVERMKSAHSNSEDLVRQRLVMNILL